jgi:hypothetical protein
MRYGFKIATMTDEKLASQKQRQLSITTRDEYLKNRLQDQIDWYDTKGMINKREFRVLLNSHIEELSVIGDSSKTESINDRKHFTFLRGHTVEENGASRLNSEQSGSG